MLVVDSGKSLDRRGKSVDGCCSPCGIEPSRLLLERWVEPVANEVEGHLKEGQVADDREERGAGEKKGVDQ